MRLSDSDHPLVRLALLALAGLAAVAAAPRPKGKETPEELSMFGNPYFHSCRYRSRLWDDCLQNVAQELRPVLVDGIAEWGVRPIDPLHVDILNFNEVSGKFRIHLQMINVTMEGLRNYIVTGIRSNLAELSIEIRLRVPSLKFRSYYHIDGSFLISRISGGGVSQFNFTDVDNKILLQGHLVRRRSDDALHLRVVSIRWSMLPSKGLSHFSKLSGGDPMQNLVATLLLNEHWQEAWSSFQGAVEAAFGEVFRERINRLFMNIPYRELFPPGIPPLHLLEQPMEDSDEDEYPPIKWERPTWERHTTLSSSTTSSTTESFTTERHVEAVALKKQTTTVASSSLESKLNKERNVSQPLEVDISNITSIIENDSFVNKGRPDYSTERIATGENEAHIDLVDVKVNEAEIEDAAIGSSSSRAAADTPNLTNDSHTHYLSINDESSTSAIPSQTSHAFSSEASPSNTSIKYDLSTPLNRDNPIPPPLTEQQLLLKDGDKSVTTEIVYILPILSPINEGEDKFQKQQMENNTLSRGTTISVGTEYPTSSPDVPVSFTGEPPIQQPNELTQIPTTEATKIVSFDSDFTLDAGNASTQEVAVEVAVDTSEKQVEFMMEKPARDRSADDVNQTSIGVVDRNVTSKQEEYKDKRSEYIVVSLTEDGIVKEDISRNNDDVVGDIVSVFEHPLNESSPLKTHFGGNEGNLAAEPPGVGPEPVPTNITGKEMRIDEKETNEAEGIIFEAENISKHDDQFNSTDHIPSHNIQAYHEIPQNMQQSTLDAFINDEVTEVVNLISNEEDDAILVNGAYVESASSSSEQQIRGEPITSSTANVHQLSEPLTRDDNKTMRSRDAPDESKDLSSVQEFVEEAVSRFLSKTSEVISSALEPVGFANRPEEVDQTTGAVAIERARRHVKSERQIEESKEPRLEPGELQVETELTLVRPVVVSPWPRGTRRQGQEVASLTVTTHA